MGIWKLLRCIQNIYFLVVIYTVPHDVQTENTLVSHFISKQFLLGSSNIKREQNWWFGDSDPLIHMDAFETFRKNIYCAATRICYIYKFLHAVSCIHKQLILSVLKIIDKYTVLAKTVVTRKYFELTCAESGIKANCLCHLIWTKSTSKIM
jgi:hypothetical protein